MTNLLTVTQAALKSGLSDRAIRKAITRGDLRAQQYGKTYVIEAAELERWLNDPAAHKTGRKVSG